MGPLRHIWCFRFEAKHRELKIYTNNTNSRKNIPYTVGVKCSLKFCDRLLNKIGLKNKLVYNNKSEVKLRLKDQLYYKYIKNLDVLSSELCDRTLIFIKEVTYLNTLYKESFFLFSKSLRLYEIVHIAIHEEDAVDCYFICIEHKLSKFNSHFQSFQVINKTNNYFVFHTQLHEFHYAPIHTYKSPNGNTYVRPKYY